MLPQPAPARPRVIINCAMSLDGKLALSDRRQTALSSAEDLRRVHAMRAASGAILVGIGTVLADDPSLLVKPALVERVPVPPPLRIVLDSRRRTPPGARILDGRAPTLIAVTEGHAAPLSHAEVRAYGAGTGRVDLVALLRDLATRGTGQVMVEGGSTVIASFLDGGLVDELDVFVAHVILGGTGPSLVGGTGATDLATAHHLALLKSRPMEGGHLLRFRPRTPREPR